MVGHQIRGGNGDCYATINLMPHLRKHAWRAAPLLLLVLYWPGLTAWFFQDDFGWLNLRHDVHSARDLAVALFAPKAHGNMRPLGENLYWLGLASLFGNDPIPFHICTLLTQVASLLLLGGIVLRLTGSRLAAFSAQILWIVNCGVASAMGWSSIYNQVLSGFFFLLAFYCLMRGFGIWQWIAFVLGLGALEINVMYPAVAAVYTLLFARSEVKKVLPMFLVSGLAVGLHFWFAPPPADGVYAPVIDVRVFGTFWTYWTWALGPLSPLLTICAVALVFWTLRHRSYAGLFGLAWFAIVLIPYLPLPDHKSDYYLAVPAIGLAITGAWAVARAPQSGWVWRSLTALAIVAYVATSVPRAWAITRWQHERGERVRTLVLGVKQIHEAAPEKIILLNGIDTDLFWSGISDLPFRAFEIPRVYLAPGSEEGIQVPADVLSKYTLPAALARDGLKANAAVIYELDGRVFRNVTGRFRAMADSLWRDDVPRFINVGDPVFSNYLGEGWSAPIRGTRVMGRNGTLHIGSPRRNGESLYVGVFRTSTFPMVIRVNGREVTTELVRKDNDLSEFRAHLPVEILASARMDVSISSDATPPLIWGYAEVR